MFRMLAGKEQPGFGEIVTPTVKLATYQIATRSMPIKPLVQEESGGGCTDRGK